MGNLEEGGSFLQRGDNWGIYSNTHLIAWNNHPYGDQDSDTNGFPGLDAAETMRGYVSGPITATTDYVYDDSDFLNADDTVKDQAGLDAYKSYWNDTTDPATAARKIAITWSYSTDCVFEITYEVAGFATRTISIKMPERQYYHALIYGENVTMTFSSATIIQSLKLISGQTIAPQIGEVQVLENMMFTEHYDKFDFTVKYNGIEQPAKVNGEMLTVYGNATAGAAKDADGWEDLATHKMSTKYKAFKVKVTVGNDSVEEVLPAAEVAKIRIIPNAIDHAKPNEVTVGDAIFITGVGSAEFLNSEITAEDPDLKPSILLSGRALTLSAAQKAALDTTKTHSVVFSLYAAGGNAEERFNATGITFDGADGKAVVNADGTQMDVILAIDKTTKTVTIEGAQGTDIIINLAHKVATTEGGTQEEVTIDGTAITSSMTSATEGKLYTQKLNETQDITIVYDLGDLANGLQATDLRDRFMLRVNNSNGYFNEAGNGPDNGGWTEEEKNKFSGINGMTVEALTFDATAKTITVKYHVPAFDPAGPTSYQFSLLDRKNSNAILAIDYLYYVADFAETVNGEADNSLSHGYYVTRSGYNLYISKAFDTQDLQTSNFHAALGLAANMGGATGATKDATLTKAHDLSFATNNDGAVSFTNGRLLRELATAKLFSFGTLNDAEDKDRGAVVVITVDVRKLGLDGKEFAFSIDDNDVNADNHYYKTAAVDGTIGADTEFCDLIKDCNVTLIFDWTDATKIVISATYTKDTTTRTVSYTVTPAAEKEFAESYNIGLGGEAICLTITNIART